MDKAGRYSRASASASGRASSASGRVNSARVSSVSGSTGRYSITPEEIRNRIRGENTLTKQLKESKNKVDASNAMRGRYEAAMRVKNVVGNRGKKGLNSIRENEAEAEKQQAKLEAEKQAKLEVNIIAIELLLERLEDEIELADELITDYTKAISKATDNNKAMLEHELKGVELEKKKKEEELKQTEIQYEIANRKYTEYFGYGGIKRKVVKRKVISVQSAKASKNVKPTVRKPTKPTTRKPTIVRRK